MLDIARLRGIVYLGVTGLFSAMVLFVLASRQLSALSAETVSNLLLAIQWHVLGFTICKFGVDYAAFAALSREPKSSIALLPLLKFPVIPLAVAFAFASLLFFPAEMAALFLISVVSDALASFRAAELNAKQSYGTTAIGNLLNYPLLLCLLLIFSLYRTPTLFIGYFCFALTSLLRFYWLYYGQGLKRHEGKVLHLSNIPLTGLQGLTNWTLFRADQLALICIPALTPFKLDPEVIGQYLFLVRIPEISTGILVLFGTVYFPKYFLSTTSERNESIRIYAQYFFAGLVMFCAAALVTFFAIDAFNGSAISTSMWTPFVLQIPLILWANLVTYSMQAQGFLERLVIHAFLSTIIGFSYICALFLFDKLSLLGWLVPLQLCVFIVLGLVAPWGDRLKVKDA